MQDAVVNGNSQLGWMMGLRLVGSCVEGILSDQGITIGVRSDQPKLCCWPRQLSCYFWNMVDLKIWRHCAMCPLQTDITDQAGLCDELGNALGTVPELLSTDYME